MPIYKNKKRAQRRDHQQQSTNPLQQKQQPFHFYKPPPITATNIQLKEIGRSTFKPATGKYAEQHQAMIQRFGLKRFNNEQQSTAPLQKKAVMQPKQISSIKATTKFSPKVVQRVIVGLEHYTAANNVPDGWANAYLEDISHSTTHLSDQNISDVYKHIRGKDIRDEENIHFNHIGGNHWTVTYNGQEYKVAPDGSCGLHAVHLADKLLKGEGGAINPNTSYIAPDNFVTGIRNLLKTELKKDENLANSIDEAKKLIASGIQNSELIITTGFGPILQGLLREAQVEQTKENKRKFFESFYGNFWSDQKRITQQFWPKPSEAKKVLPESFFENKKSIDELCMDGLKNIYKQKNSMEMYVDEHTRSKVKKNKGLSLEDFMTPQEVAEQMKAIPSKFQIKKARKKRLREGRYLPKEKIVGFRKKLKSPLVRRKLMRASRLAVLKFKKDEKSKITELISKGNVSLKDTPMNTEQVLESLHAFTSSDSKSKNDLQVGSGGNQYTSIGQGGLQVKGLGTYSDEIKWFREKMAKWKANPKDLFRAIMLRNVDEVKNLTNASETDLKHLLSFHTLQIEEIFRGLQFGLGQAAHYRLGFHGQRDFPQYMLNMPMYESNATTNVSKTEDWEKPHNQELWTEQEESMFKGLQELSEMDIDEGQVYDEKTLHLMQQIDMLQEDEEEPKDELVAASYEFMMSPNPYINDSEDEKQTEQEN